MARINRARKQEGGGDEGESEMKKEGCGCRKGKFDPTASQGEQMEKFFPYEFFKKYIEF